ncbi:hypothetical protein ACROYT_G034318 [Oculina patagonica]
MLNSNSTDNDTNLANTSIPADGGNPFEDFFKAAFGSAIFMFVVSFVTILANSLLLLVLCIDPLKIFRNTTTYFLIGLAIVDLLTGLVQEPIYATCFMFLYLQHPLTWKCQPFMEFAVITITIRLFMEEKYAPSAITVVIANLMMDNLLYLKFLFDPLVYAWRMPKYRESLNKIVCRRSIERESSRNENQNLLAAGVSHDGELSTELNRSAITLLSFKNIEVSPFPLSERPVGQRKILTEI